MAKKRIIENSPGKNISLWDKYEYKGALSIATAEDLRPIVRRAAKAANMRLIRLERQNKTGGAYKIAQKRLAAHNQRRFKERTDKLDLAALRLEYAQLRDFLAAKTSTIGGYKEVIDKRYNTAKARGFKGTLTEFNELSERLWTEKIEKIYSSDVIYDVLISNDDDEIQDIINKADETEYIEERTKGENLLKHLRAKSKK